MRGSTNQAKVLQLLQELGRASTGPGAIFVVGGTSAVLLGWRQSTNDADLSFGPEPAGVFAAVSRLKDELDMNVELAAPSDFIPPLPGWRERCIFIDRFGQVDCFHYDFYSQALAKLERNHRQDRLDVQAMAERSLVDANRQLELLEAIVPAMERYPALDPPSFRANVVDFVQEFGGD